MDHVMNSIMWEFSSILMGTLVAALVLYCRLRSPIVAAGKGVKSPETESNTQSLSLSTDAMIESIRTLGTKDETASALWQLVCEDGAGSWPPKVDHDSWPAALRPYKDIYLEVVPLLSTTNPSLDDEVNGKRREHFQSMMRTLLADRIDVLRVEEIMLAVQEGDWEDFPRECYNGFYCCIAVCRHAYRWATIPVVKVAQLEKFVEFPPELDVPWPYLQRVFGVDAQSGNNTANVLHNFDSKGNRVYQINVGMSEVIRSSEDSFFRMFHRVEVLALPIYHEMVHAIVEYQDNKIACLRHLQTLTSRVRDVFQVFYDTLKDSRISKQVWLSYIQGFQGWGVGTMVNGQYVKYDGLSGNHVLVFQAIDAFLGMDRYLSDENMERYVPARQREFCLLLKKHSLRNKLNEKSDADIKEEISAIAKHVRVFRAAHRTRVKPYLRQPAPERLTMTAGKSLLAGGNIEESIETLDELMLKRLQETVL